METIIDPHFITESKEPIGFKEKANQLVFEKQRLIANAGILTYDLTKAKKLAVYQCEKEVEYWTKVRNDIEESLK